MWNSEQKRRSLSERLYQLSLAVDQAYGQPDQLTDGQKTLLKDLRTIIAVVNTTIDRDWATFSGVKDPAERERSRWDLCSTFEYLIQKLSQDIVPVLSGSSSSLVPVELEPVVQREVASAAPDWDWQPILYSSTQYDYSIVPLPPAEDILDAISAVPPSGQVDTHQLLALSTPAIERESIALHAVLLGHEMGHLHDWYHKVSEEFHPPPPRDWTGSDGQVDLEHADLFEVFLDVVANWGSELSADIYACLLLGPVALLALPEFSATMDVAEADSTTHPGTDRRIRLMVEVLADGGFGTVPYADELITEYGERYKDAWDRPVKLSESVLMVPTTEAWRALRDEIPRLKQKCLERFPQPHIFRPEEWQRVATGASLLERGLPCSELDWSQERGSMLATVPVILNAAWVVKTSSLSKISSIVGKELQTIEAIGEVSQVLDRLVTKSIEIINHEQDDGVSS